MADKKPKPKSPRRLRVTLSPEFSERVRRAIAASAPPEGKPFVTRAKMDGYLVRIVESEANPERFVAHALEDHFKGSSLPFGLHTDEPVDVDAGVIRGGGDG